MCKILHRAFTVFYTKIKPFYFFFCKIKKLDSNSSRILVEQQHPQQQIQASIHDDHHSAKALCASKKSTKKKLFIPAASSDQQKDPTEKSPPKQHRKRKSPHSTHETLLFNPVVDLKSTRSTNDKDNQVKSASAATISNNRNPLVSTQNSTDKFQNSSLVTLVPLNSIFLNEKYNSGINMLILQLSFLELNK